MLLLADLWTSQDDLRLDTNALLCMISFVRAGGVFSQEAIASWSKSDTAPLIAITEFEDGARMVHDGHHRATSICLGGRDHLDNAEYFVKRFTYADYLRLEPANGWFTPYDPKTHVRLHDFGEYKRQARDLFNRDPERLPAFVAENRHRYCCRREVASVVDLAHIIALRDHIAEVTEEAYFQ